MTARWIPQTPIIAAALKLQR
uniref:Uncharacterized protein n=1 Tax=Anguilla anguilla TaxID=7936 RepID=A0A0E9TED3_ANGAN